MDNKKEYTKNTKVLDDLNIKFISFLLEIWDDFYVDNNWYNKMLYKSGDILIKYNR